MLNEVSLGLLPRSDGKLVMDTYDVRVVSSTKDLLRPHRQPSASTAVVIGNPKFSMSEKEPDVASATPAARSRDARRGGALDPLPGTQVEVQNVDKLLRSNNWQVQTYTDAEAQVTRVKQVERPRLLHVATHGFFEPDQKQELPAHTNLPSEERPSMLEDPMLRSGLYFAGANRALQGAASTPGGDDGVLTAYEASQLHLEGTELVVLSACETGLGETQNGEGVFGLRRALQEAGAEFVLMSLWKMPDQETQELMQKFYQKWLAGEDKGTALHEAQQELREAVRQRYGKDHPYYWGAFVLVGH